MPGEDRHPHAGSTDGQVRDTEDLAALVAQLLVLVGLPGSVVDQRAGQRNHIEGDRRDVLLRCREIQSATVVHELLDAVDHRAGLSRQFLDTGQTTAGDRLIGRDNQSHQLCFVVQRFEHRHRRHGGAVRVGDDALGQLHAAHIAIEIDLADHQGNIGVLAPGRRIIDHRGTGRGETRGLNPRHGRPGGEQRDVQTAGVGGLGVFDFDLLPAIREHASL